MDYTKEEILKLCSRLYSFTGIEPISVSELDKDASVEDFNIAWLEDRNYFRGLADTIYTIT
tara:strand:- start:274 stop:456 length:183 start_codon:yes stop_codon:yes gene_type:complete